ncbi:GrpE nucleotide exchange factor protein [Dioscorea alata]|uniref:GrpE nucleotide exchange factor protein n=1 Tax=Dioscorea alata TaxID=55571 RepID=A0ACB7WME1_DIOAL|nr:GrpE nucleotide exchange factor protein [Dioscorea alata]
MASRVFARISRYAIGRQGLVSVSAPQEPFWTLSNGFHTVSEWKSSPLSKFPHCSSRTVQLGYLPPISSSIRHYWFSSSASPQPTDKEKSPITGESEHVFDDGKRTESTETNVDSSSSEKTGDSDEETELSMGDLVQLVAEKEELLKIKHKELEQMQDKVLRAYAEMENVLGRTKRETENSKKFAIQNFAKNLLDVADNLGRASSVVKESFLKIDSSKDSAGAVPLLKTLLEGVEMTEKQLAEVFKKFGVEKFDPINERFDPNRHHAMFQVPDASKPSGTIATVLKSGYMIYDRVLRPAEVGVTEGGVTEDSDDKTE